VQQESNEIYYIQQWTWMALLDTSVKTGMSYKHLPKQNKDNIQRYTLNRLKLMAY